MYSFIRLFVRSSIHSVGCFIFIHSFIHSFLNCKFHFPLLWQDLEKAGNDIVTSLLEVADMEEASYLHESSSSLGEGAMADQVVPQNDVSYAVLYVFSEEGE